MRKVILYIAQSLDGFIAKPNGDISWLEEVPNPDKNDYGYSSFVKSIDTVIMGRKTFEQVMGFDMPYPYVDKESYVFSNQKVFEKSKHVMFITNDHLGFVRDLKSRPGKAIWLVGGGGVNTFFLKHNLINEMRIFLMPVILGDGIPIFNKRRRQQHFTLSVSKSYASGVIELQYTFDTQNKTIL